MFAKVSVIERPFKKENPNFDIGSTYFALIVNDYVCMIVEDEPYTIAIKYFDVLEHYNVDALKNSISNFQLLEKDLRETISNLRDNVQREATDSNNKDSLIRLLNEKIELQEKMFAHLENNPKTVPMTMQSIFGQQVKSIEFK